jgi:oligopeptide transport system permease protein
MKNNAPKLLTARPSNLYKDAWIRLRKNKMAFISLIIVGIYLFVSLIAPVLPLSYDEQVIEHQFLPPSFRKAGELAFEKQEAYLQAFANKENRPLNENEVQRLAEFKNAIASDPIHNRVYLLGTDGLGRDMLARLIYGGRVSILIGIVGSFTAVLIGMVLGALAGYKGGKTDRVIVISMEVLYSLPYMLIVIIFMALFGQNLINLFVAIALISWLTQARVVRGQVISLKNSGFVEAARMMEASSWHVIKRHLLPNCLNIMIVFASMDIPVFILSESFLSYLGLGVSAPLASWGTLVKDGVDNMYLHSWLLIVPASAMGLFLFAMNFLGDGLRDAFDPKGKNV